MNDRNGKQWLAALSLMCCVPGFAETIYKSIDADGVVSFSDTRPVDDILVETLEIDEQVPPSSEQAQQQLQDMRETTDRMVAARMAREKHRAELRQLDAQADAQQTSQDFPDDDYYDDSPLYTGYYDYPVRRPWRRNHDPRPEHPIARPPLRPPIHNRPPDFRPSDFDYPASLIRRHYDPKVREAFR